MEFKKIIYSGTCKCGHSWQDHHLGIVANIEAAKIIGDYLPQECEYYGCNEDGGLDKEGNPHCSRYIDREDPDDNNN